MQRPAHTVLRAVVVTAVLGVASAPTTGRAEPVVGVEARSELAFSDAPAPAPALGATFGYALDTYPLLLVPELAVSGAWYPTLDDAASLRAMAGARVGLTTLVEPALFVHAGYGARLGNVDVHGAAVDAGLAVDKRLGRDLTLGGAIGYQGLVAGAGSLHAVALAFRATFWL
jgi:hypothetical protein